MATRGAATVVTWLVTVEVKLGGKLAYEPIQVIQSVETILQDTFTGGECRVQG